MMQCFYFMVPHSQDKGKRVLHADGLTASWSFTRLRRFLLFFFHLTAESDCLQRVIMIQSRGETSVFLFSADTNRVRMRVVQLTGRLRSSLTLLFYESAGPPPLLSFKLTRPLFSSFSSQESHKKAKKERTETLNDDQLFVVDLARDLSRVCQRSAVLEHIWNLEDTWPTLLCRAFILQWASVLETKTRPMQTDGWPETVEGKLPDPINEQDLLQAKARILNWVKDLRAQPEQSVWPGEPVAKVLEDLQSAWRWGRVPYLLTAMELLMWTLVLQRPDKDTIPQQWLTWKQRSQNIGAISYVPQPVWNWISDAAVEVTLDLDSANPDLLISGDEKKMRCGFERKDVPNHHQRFDGWWCAVGAEGLGPGRYYWEVEVGERDWRLGVAKESALRKGFKSLNTNTGYLTLRLERGTELKALTVPFTALPPGLIPRKVDVYLDYDNGQLSFYDVDKHFHIYTYNESFTEKLFPLFGTVEIVKDLVIRSPAAKTQCLCSTSCLWG